MWAKKIRGLIAHHSPRYKKKNNLYWKYRIDTRIHIKTQIQSFKSAPYYQRLANIKQENYFGIRTYEIKTTCQKFALCCDCSQDLLVQKSKEASFANLKNHVKIKMQRPKKHLMFEICETIEKIEVMKIEEL